MNQDEYLNQLGGALNTLAPEEIMDIQSYYANSIQGQVLNGVSEEQAVQNLGPAEQVASRIMDTRAQAPQRASMGRNMTGPRKKKRRGLAIAGIVVAVCVAASAGLSVMQSTISGIATGSQSFSTAAATVQSISINAGSDDVRFETSDDDDIHVEWDNTNTRTHDVTQSGDALTLTTETHAGSDGWWMDDDEGITVQLPAGYVAGDMKIQSSSGDIDADSIMVTGSLTVQSTSGDISCYDITVPGTLTSGSTSGSVYYSYGTFGAFDISSTSGYLSIYNCTASGDSTIGTTSGYINMDDSTFAKNLKVDSTSGSVDMSTSVVRGNLDVNTTSGSIDLSMSGMASDYALTTDTVSGSVDVPQTNASAERKITISTISGSIEASFDGDEVAEGDQQSYNGDENGSVYVGDIKDLDSLGEYIDQQVDQGMDEAMRQISGDAT